MVRSGPGVDADRFVRELPRLFADYPRSEHPRDRRFAPILEDVGGLARENNLALLNLAASLLGARRELRRGRLVQGAQPDRGDARELRRLRRDRQLLARRRQPEAARGEPPPLRSRRPHHPGRGRVQRSSRGGALGDRRVGVYYYDAAHDYRSQVRGLRLIEPYLADDALLIVDDTDWEQVARAIRDYLAGQPRAELVVKLDGKDLRPALVVGGRAGPPLAPRGRARRAAPRGRASPKRCIG